MWFFPNPEKGPLSLTYCNYDTWLVGTGLAFISTSKRTCREDAACGVKVAKVEEFG
jgi:hypothetical protein